jgi:hypothetical protein
VDARLSRTERLCRVDLVRQDVIYDTVGDSPSNEIQLSDSRREALKLYALGPAKGIEQFLAVAVKTALVGYMHSKRLARLSGVRHVTILRVIGHKPFKTTQRDAVLMCQNVLQLVAVFGLAEKSRERF